MIIKGCDKIAVDWGLDGFFVVAQGNQTVKISPNQAVLLKKYFEEHMSNVRSWYEEPSPPATEG